MATVTPHLSNPDPNANPTTFQGLVDNLNPLFDTVNVDGGPFTPPVISSTTPAVSDQDKIWAKVDGNGRPLGLFKYYNGNWRIFYTGKAGQVSQFSGNPATYFDGTGKGLIGLDWDGWALCNGQNGTPNLSDLFIVGARMDNVNVSGYAAHWQTNVTGTPLQTGGGANYSIKNTDLPNMTTNVSGRPLDTNASNAIKHTIVTGQWSNAALNTDADPASSFGANPPTTPQTSVPTIPPFYAMALALFIGYT